MCVCVLQGDQVSSATKWVCCNVNGISPAQVLLETVVDTFDCTREGKFHTHGCAGMIALALGVSGDS